MSSTAIEVHDIGKQYTIGKVQQGSSYKSLRATIMSSLSSALSGLGGGPSDPANKIWALRNVSFTIDKGEVVGVIGPNGAGKTTLLKILSRITPPTSGEAHVHGNVGSLLEVGTGFHPELTGRENVYLNGSVLGMTSSEIEKKFDDILAFAGVEEFVDTPIKHYSAGMKVRLAFSVAAHLDTEILLVDEVLAVGDAQFQKKCLSKMNDITEAGRTVLFVSHDMDAVSRLCERTIWLDDGEVQMEGSTKEIISSYLTENLSTSAERQWEDGLSDPGITSFQLFATRIKDTQGNKTTVLQAEEDFWIEFDYQIREPLPYCRVGFLLSTPDGTAVFEAYDADLEKFAGPVETGRYRSRCKVPGKFLNIGDYIVTIHADVPERKVLLYQSGVFQINIEDVGTVGSHLRSERQGVVRPELRWTREEMRT